MSAPVSRKLANSFEGALAGGGDPATSPLYVFGPFLRLIVVAGVAQITFGVSLWLVVLTIAMVSVMYRLVMTWVTDGSGGSGLSEEEFGGWAVKVNASITFIEYTLTFLVSMAALVTFIADRFQILNETLFGIQYRTFVAIVLSILTGWAVNRGPKMAARVFGPATAGVLALLWLMIAASLYHRFSPGAILAGVPVFPNFSLAAFSGEYLFEFTLGGYVRILAVMTGIEVFANLVAAYEGDAATKSRKAFGSLIIIMGTTSLTMLIVGPAILALSDPVATDVSVFTQTMDLLLPQPLAQLGTLVGVAVLLSASAASAQGLQNLALGLKNRHYVPAILGQRNRFDVADWPVWIEVAIVVFCFLLFGTYEETYLAFYAAGVFILLSMTGWAAAKRLLRQFREGGGLSQALTFAGTVVAAFLTTGAMLIIFEERFLEGAWIYIPLVIGLYLFFSYFRHQLGDPSPLREELGRREEAMYGLGIPLGQPKGKPLSLEMSKTKLMGEPVNRLGQPKGKPLSLEIEADESLLATGVIEMHGDWKGQRASIERVMVALDGSEFAERVIPLAATLCKLARTPLILLSVLPGRGPAQILPKTNAVALDQPGLSQQEAYLLRWAAKLRAEGIEVDYALASGPVPAALCRLTDDLNGDMLIMSTRGRSGMSRWLMGSVANAVVQLIDKPVLLLRPEKLSPDHAPRIDRVLVTLDGSPAAENILPYVKALADTVDVTIILLTVPEVPEPEFYGAMSDAVQTLRIKAESNAWHYLEAVAHTLRKDGANVRTIVTGSRPATTIAEISQTERVDLIMMATHGRGGMDRLVLGSVADRLIHHTDKPVFLAPVETLRSGAHEP